jgi:glycosyltransferase involved in cell wall biosynthesis
VIVHNLSAAEEVARFGPVTTRVVAHPFFPGTLPPPPADRDAVRASFGLEPADLAVLFFGNVERYKGVDLLLRAAVTLPERSPVRLLVAGLCPDPGLRGELDAQLAAAAGRVASASLRYASDEELSRLLGAADLAVFPFRAVTTSGSVRLALSAGVPVLLPDLAGLREFPDTVALRYPPGFDGLVSALGALDAHRDRLPAMGARAREIAAGSTWAAAAEETRDLYERLRAGAPCCVDVRAR